MDTADETDFGYTGQREIEGSELMDYNARFLNPGLARFTQPDTIIPNPANPQSLNRYTYVNNNPIRYIDPSGYCKGDPNDPDNTDLDCWLKIDEIEELYGFVEHQ